MLSKAKKRVTINEQLYGFMLRNSTTDVMPALKVLMDTYRKG